MSDGDAKAGPPQPRITAVRGSATSVRAKSPTDVPFHGTDRFEVLGTLGTGGAGTVYRVFDHEQQAEVALKRLRHATGRDLYRFKREFRALADLVHPNLVALHELVARGDEWYLTMELVEGVTFLDWVRPSPPARRPERSDIRAEAPPSASQGGARGPRSRQDIIDAPVDLDRLRGALVQLVDALVALHAAGMVHRDLKPSNVVVTPVGRAVLLDFGLIVDRAERTTERIAVGTPAYMSPEQAADKPLTVASDWYSLGAMLYEALTGRRPLEGPAEQVMRRKQTELPAAPSDIVPGIPEDLDGLCVRLLQPDPAARPDGAAILAELGAVASASTHDVARATARGPFVGRRDELAILHRAFVDCRRRGVAVFVQGGPGLGKTALIRRFLDQVGAGALVLEARCYEREQVPFKLLDPVVDALGTALVGFDPAELEPLLPRELASLARLFPVLRRVPRIAELVANAPTPPDPLELRRRAFAALRHVLGRLARRRTVIVSVDDVQWGDADSAVFLADIVHHVEPALMFIFAHRLHDDSGVVAEIRRAGSAAGKSADLRDVVVGPLPVEDARMLARELADDDERAEAAVAGAAGSPLLLAELARAGDEATFYPAASVETLVAARAARLPAPVRTLLAAIGVAASPLPLEVAAAAAGIGGGQSEAALLASERLVRVRRIEGIAQVEPAHEQVARAVNEALDPGDVIRWHRALARAYESTGSGPPEAIVEHWVLAGQPANAAAHAAPAAARAEAVLAFRRAAELYDLALAHGTMDAAQRCDLLRRRGHALACAGQLDAAAAAYGEAATLAVGDDTIELARLQIEQLLHRGRLQEGLAVAERVLAAVGLDLALTRPAPRRRPSKLKQLELAPQLAGPRDLRRVDVLQSLASGLHFVDPWLGRTVQERLVREALAAGDPFRLCLALAQEVAYTAGAGQKSAKTIEATVERLRQTALRVGHPHVIGVADAAAGAAAFLAGRFRDARRFLEPSLDTLRNYGTDVRWDIDVAEIYLASALYWLGDLRELARLVPMAIRDARDRGDRFAQIALRSWRPNVAWLVAGKPADARAHLAAADDEPDGARYVVQPYFRFVGEIQVDLYADDGAAAWARVAAAWSGLEKSGVLGRQVMRVEAWSSRGRAALAAAAIATDARGRADLIKIARTAGDRLIDEQVAWSAGQGHLVRGLAALATDRRAAANELARAEEALGRADLAAWQLAARFRRAELDGGPGGMARAEGARDALRDLGVADPDAFLRLMAPRAG